MQTFSPLIAWDDDDTEQGEYGTTVRAASVIEAEQMARAEMRTFHQENYDDDGEEHMQPDGTFGGRLIEAAPGAIWKAQDLENALRAMVATELFLGDHPQRQSAYHQARKLLAEIDGLPTETPTEATR
jgi:hypothetical protein